MIEAKWLSALAEWQKILGDEFVSRDPGQLASVETTTFFTDQKVTAILRPSSREQVQACLRIATRFQVPVYPRSSGKNWGYGSGVPPQSQCAILDLSRMNRILDCNEKLAYVTVEPGVTQQQLYDFLSAQKSKLWMDATGSSPQTSLIGNTMERGFGHTPDGDHFAQSCGLEVVLPTGDVIETGYSRFPASVTGPLYRWGVGPFLDGLFSQSNFGVVTRMTIWLMPAPAHFEAFLFRCDHQAQLGPLIEVLSRLRLAGTIKSAVHVGNDYKVLSSIQQYPWDITQGKTPLLPAQMDSIRKRLHFGVWNGSGGLYGTKAQVATARREIRRALSGKVTQLRFLDDRMLAFSIKFARPIKFFSGWDFSKTIALLQPLFGLLKGIPTDRVLASVYWRKKGPVPVLTDPDQARCGLLWYAPIVPADSADVDRVRHLTVDTLLAAGFEPMISLTLITGRAIACVISISYDRDVPGEDERALACYRTLAAKITALGYYSYRLGIQSMEEMGSSESYLDLLAKIKSAIDPAGILAPGRYEVKKSPRASAAKAS